MIFKNANLLEAINVLAEKNSSYPLTYAYCDRFMQKNGGYIDVARTFLNNGKKGKKDDKLFYKWIQNVKYDKSKVLKMLKEKGLDDDFIFTIHDELHGEGKTRPNPKWHFLISYCAYKEYVSTEEYRKEYEENGDTKWYDPIENFESLALINDSRFVGEFKLWILEALGAEIGISVEDIEKNEKSYILKIINERWNDDKIVYDFKEKSLKISS